MELVNRPLVELYIWSQFTTDKLSSKTLSVPNWIEFREILSV